MCGVGEKDGSRMTSRFLASKHGQTIMPISDIKIMEKNQARVEGRC